MSCLLFHACNFVAAALQNAVLGAINIACQPGGAIHGAIERGLVTACQPDGAIHGAIQRGLVTACQSDGAIHGAACQSDGAIHGAIQRGISNALEENDRKVQARWINQHLHDRTSQIETFANQAGAFPQRFPRDLEAFYSMDAQQTNELLAFYNLPGDGALETQRSRLARHFYLGNLIQ